MTPPAPRKAPSTLLVIGMFSSLSVVTVLFSLLWFASSHASLLGPTSVLKKCPSTLCAGLFASLKLLYIMLSSGAVVITRSVPYHVKAFTARNIIMT